MRVIECNILSLDESDVDVDTTMASGAAEADSNAEATPSRGGVGGGAEDLCAEKNKTKGRQKWLKNISHHKLFFPLKNYNYLKNTYMVTTKNKIIYYLNFSQCS